MVIFATCVNINCHSGACNAITYLRICCTMCMFCMRRVSSAVAFRSGRDSSHDVVHDHFGFKIHESVMSERARSTANMIQTIAF